MDPALVQFVWYRARHYCEYCQIPEEYEDDPLELDHIIAVKHDGPTVAGNLALSCGHDNSHKGSNIAGLDPKTRKLTPLFNPRRHRWARHFRWDGAVLVGRTAIGRVTISVLNINDPVRVELRQALIEEGFFPPE